MHRRPDDESEYQPISDHGIIGDLRTCALVDDDATIDWFCAGRFDRPSVFGSVLDPDAGSWTMQVIDGATRTAQFYFPDSAILVTRFLTEEGVAEVHDFMPVVAAHEPHHRQRIVRRVTCVRGAVTVRTELRARPDYGRCVPDVEAGDGFVTITGAGLRLGLTATHPLDTSDATVRAEVQLRAGEEARFALHVLEDDEVPSDADVGDLFERTAAYWRSWLSQSTYTGRWREMVDRSAITLKLLTHEPTGAIIAAPTTSLPEEIGGGRNWDYRFVWIRDAAFSLYALLRLGFTDEAASFMAWLSRRLGERTESDDGSDLGPLRVLYDIDGKVPDAEYELDHLRGYLDSRPVRVGNAAVDQLQLDIYGELIDSVYLFNKYGPGLSHDAWSDLTAVLEWLMDNWQRDDPRFLSTLAVIEERLVSDSLVFRYDLGRTTDGLDGPEGTFSLCSFWYVEALTRAGRLDDARLALEKMFTYANHLGLYAEQVGLTGEQLGNFPQAFTHLSLISAAMNLDRELG